MLEIDAIYQRATNYFYLQIQEDSDNITDEQCIVLAVRKKNVVFSQWIVDSNIQAVYWKSNIILQKKKEEKHQPNFTERCLLICPL